MTLTYVTPPGIPCRLMKGAHVAVCDRTGAVMEIEKIKRSGTTVMTLEGGRQFRHLTGYWIGGSQDWPFPFVRQCTWAEIKKYQAEHI